MMPFDHQATAERYAAALNKGELDIIDELFTDDYTDESPQSGEVMRGRNNLRAVMAQRPGDRSQSGADITTMRVVASDQLKVVAPLFTVVRVQGRGDAGTMAIRIRYHDGSRWWLILIYELRDGRYARSTSFFAPEFEPAAYRAQYVEVRPRPETG